jgi:hypothetical protein
MTNNTQHYDRFTVVTLPETLSTRNTTTRRTLRPRKPFIVSLATIQEHMNSATDKRNRMHKVKRMRKRKRMHRRKRMTPLPTIPEEELAWIAPPLPGHVMRFHRKPLRVLPTPKTGEPARYKYRQLSPLAHTDVSGPVVLHHLVLRRSSSCY